MLKDPVCGMEGKKNITSTYKGKKYYFCSSVCQWVFEKNPKQFVKS